jgi:hypothetical protein
MFSSEEVLYGAIFVLGNIFLSFSVFTYIAHLLHNKETPAQQYDLLKNALFSMALTTVYSENIEHNNHDYNTYDGSTLPPMSGCDIVNAFASYMTDSENPHIHAKFNAIQRFIHSNLSTEAQQENFLQEFIIKLNNIIENAQSDAEEEGEAVTEPESPLDKGIKED